MSPLQALNDMCRALCGPSATQTGRHDDACLVVRDVFTEWARLQVRGDEEAELYIDQLRRSRDRAERRAERLEDAIERMLEDPDAYFAEARELARQEIEAEDA
jgi:hypothetical protein